MKKERLNKKGYLNFRKLAAALNISFSKCIAIGNKIFGLDEKNKRLVISDGQGDDARQQIIELEKVKSISLKKSYDSIHPGDLKKKTIQDFLKYVRLQFEYSNNGPQTILSFYDREKDNPVDLRKLDSNSKYMHRVLSRLIGEKKDTAVSVSNALQT